MRGPLPTTNWVVPGLLMCGAEPTGQAAARLVAFGMRSFVCLQAELSELPYRRRAERACADGLEFVHEPIEDGATFEAEEALLPLVAHIVSTVRGGTPVYVHCKGGHGRSGIVVACVLGELYPHLTAAEVLARVQAYHDARANPRGTLRVRPRSPQTAAQRRQAETVLRRRSASCVRTARELLLVSGAPLRA